MGGRSGEIKAEINVQKIQRGIYVQSLFINATRESKPSVDMENGQLEKLSN